MKILTRSNIKFIIIKVKESNMTISTTKLKWGNLPKNIGQSQTCTSIWLKNLRTLPQDRWWKYVYAFSGLLFSSDEVQDLEIHALNLDWRKDSFSKKKIDRPRLRHYKELRAVNLLRAMLPYNISMHLQDKTSMLYRPDEGILVAILFKLASLLKFSLRSSPRRQIHWSWSAKKLADIEI